MLPRTLTRTLRQQVSDDVRSSFCAVCSCSCGRLLFRPNGLPIQQKRFREPRPNRMPHAELVRLQKEGKAKRDRDRDHFDVEQYRELLVRLKNHDLWKHTVDDGLAFLSGFDQLVREQRASKGEGSGRVKEEQLEWLMKSTNMDGDDVGTLAYSMTTILEDVRELGKKLMESTARTGNVMAVTNIIVLALRDLKTRPRGLMSTELAPVRKRLALLAEAPSGDSRESRLDTFVTKLVEGKVQHSLGNIERAIELWTECCERFRITAISDLWLGAWATYRLNFPEPWVELTRVCLARGDRGRAKWAINIGCLEGDATSHYDAALFELAESKYGKHVATSTWLYHMTKAAGAGHVKAAHMLGCWYASSTWPYVADEPPDQIKPTPFDTYPPDAGSQAPKAPLWHRIRVNLGLFMEKKDDDAKESIFHQAAFPATAADRAKMAMQWLQVGMLRNYAPSYLAAARLRLRDTLQSQASVPRSAIELSDERYVYASRADFEAGVKIHKESNDTADEADDIPNPLYDPPLAMELIINIFLAKEALKVRRQQLAAARSRGQMGTSVLGRAEARQYLNSLPWDVRKWFRYSDVRTSFMDDEKGRLWDWEAGLDLEVEARKICDDWGWDIRDPEGALIYMHKGKRG